MTIDPFMHDDDIPRPAPEHLKTIARRMLRDREVFRSTMPTHYISDPLLEELLGLYVADGWPEERFIRAPFRSRQSEGVRRRWRAVLLADGLAVGTDSALTLSKTGRALIEQALSELLSD